MGILSRALGGLGAGIQQKAVFDYRAQEAEVQRQFQEQLSAIERQHQDDRDDKQIDARKSESEADRNARQAEIADNQTFTADENDKTRKAQAADRAATRSDAAANREKWTTVSEDANTGVIRQESSNGEVRFVGGKTKASESYEDIPGKDANGNPIVIAQRERTTQQLKPITVTNEYGASVASPIPESGPPQASSSIVDVSTPEEVSKLASGTRFRLPNGQTGTRR